MSPQPLKDRSPSTTRAPDATEGGLGGRAGAPSGERGRSVRPFVVAAVITVGVIALAVVLTRGSSSPAATTASGPATTQASAPTSVTGAVGGPTAADAEVPPTVPAPGADASSSVVPPSAPSSVAPAADPQATAPQPLPAPEPQAPKVIPVNASVSGTSGLADGAKVAIHVSPQAGSQAFAYEAFLCKAGATFSNDADIRPTQMGKCLPEPLSASSDNRTEVIGQAPYQALDGTFRVGVGSRTFRTQRGETVTITCGPGNPCQLVLKLQYPNGFGFKAFPLSY